MAGYALVDQFCRAGELQGHFFRRCQREFRDDVLPALAFVEAHGEIAGLTAALAELEILKAEKEARDAALRVKSSGDQLQHPRRGRGRPPTKAGHRDRDEKSGQKPQTGEAETVSA